MSAVLSGNLSFDPSSDLPIDLLTAIRAAKESGDIKSKLKIEEYYVGMHCQHGGILSLREKIDEIIPLEEVREVFTEGCARVSVYNRIRTDLSKNSKAVLNQVMKLFPDYLFDSNGHLLPRDQCEIADELEKVFANDPKLIARVGNEGIRRLANLEEYPIFDFLFSDVVMRAHDKSVLLSYELCDDFHHAVSRIGNNVSNELALSQAIRRIIREYNELDTSKTRE